MVRASEERKPAKRRKALGGKRAMRFIEDNFTSYDWLLSSAPPLRPQATGKAQLARPPLRRPRTPKMPDFDSPRMQQAFKDYNYLSERLGWDLILRSVDREMMWTLDRLFHEFEQATSTSAALRAAQGLRDLAQTVKDQQLAKEVRSAGAERPAPQRRAPPRRWGSTGTPHVDMAPNRADVSSGSHASSGSHTSAQSSWGHVDWQIGTQVPSSPRARSPEVSSAGPHLRPRRGREASSIQPRGRSANSAGQHKVFFPPPMLAKPRKGKSTTG